MQPSIYFITLIMVFLMNTISAQEDRKRAADLGITVGTMKPGPLNAITDVPGVRVGQVTLIKGDSVRSGVTAILPHDGNIFQQKVPAGIECFNGFGKLAGYTQVRELGNLETPIILTNTLNVGTAMNALVQYTLNLPGNESVRSVNAVVGETNDGYLNDIRGRHVSEADILNAIASAKSGPVDEGSVGAGTGTIALGFKGGIGTASRITSPIDSVSYTVGVLVQSNFGSELILNGLPMTSLIKQKNKASADRADEDGSCMIVIATDAPLSDRNLQRLAKRAFSGMARTTTVMSNGSGDYAIAFSTAYRIAHADGNKAIPLPALLGNDAMTALFRAVEEATQEAIYNSLFMATTIRGHQGRKAQAIPLQDVLEIIRNRKELIR